MLSTPQVRSQSPSARRDQLQHLPVSAQVLSAMRRHAEAVYPDECVGAMLSDNTAVVLTLPLINTAQNRHAGFAVSARDFLKTQAVAENEKLAVYGFYHSHPNGLTQPSANDTQEASSAFRTLIIPIQNGRAGIPRSYRFDEKSLRFCDEGDVC